MSILDAALAGQRNQRGELLGNALADRLDVR
jgi:hypothetical protein